MNFAENTGATSKEKEEDEEYICEPKDDKEEDYEQSMYLIYRIELKREVDT